MGIFIQDTWTKRRLTLSPGLRWDHFNSSLPEQNAAAGRFVPARRFEAVENLPNWNTIVPRFGGSYDLTGRGRTAIKGNIGLYVQSQGTGFAMTYSPSLVAVDQRTWTDFNRDDIAQENEIGPTSNLNFGTAAQHQSRSEYHTTLPGGGRHRRPAPAVPGLRPRSQLRSPALRRQHLDAEYRARRPCRLHPRVGARSARQRPERCPSTTWRRASWGWSTSSTPTH